MILIKRLLKLIQSQSKHLCKSGIRKTISSKTYGVKMRYLFVTIVFYLISISVFAQAPYQWSQKQVGSSLGGPIDYSMLNTNIVYYGSDNKIYKSTDRGESFLLEGTTVPGASKIKNIILNDAIPGTFIVAIESSPNDKIYKTTNDGVSWLLTLDEGQMSYFGIPMTQDPSNPNTIFTMVGVNFKKSTDFGSTWTTISSGFGPTSAPCDIEVFPGTNIILIGDNGTGIFKSTDYGQSWAQKYSTGGEIPTISVDFTNPGIAWATKWGGGGGLLKSTDYGETWNLQPGFTGISMWGVHIQPTDGNIILTNSYSTSPGSWRSTNAGVSWTPINIPSTGYQVVSVDSTTQFAAQGNGFYKLESDYFNNMILTSFTALIEGFYNGTSMNSDTITVQLRTSSSPFNLVDQTKILLDNNGTGTGSFSSAINGTQYYLVVKHRNGIETWSALPQAFTANSLSYDFSTGPGKAFGNNLKLVGTKWCIYGGDVNQDGFVETADMNLVFNNNVIGATGYNNTDLNGDTFTEIGDLNIVFTNNVLGVMRKSPAGFITSKVETLNDELNKK